ncbi:hypothetical protein HZC53_00485 [Candidatus Uhrbacteria bacterium]|nr:hypothetical protein [Candidatus Uhrbacteria bacterium]
MQQNGKGPLAKFAGHEYEVIDLGRPAAFLIPGAKLKVALPSGTTVEEHLKDILLKEFGAFSVTELPYVGLWRNHERDLICDRSMRYEVSFVGQDRIPLLMGMLARIAAVVGEECIYFTAGEDACLIKPV